MSETLVPSVPPLPSGLDPALKKFLDAIAQIVLVREGTKGDSLDANVTFRDLVDAGIAISGAYTPNPGTGSPIDPASITDSTPPPDPTNVGVTSSTASVMISWRLPANRANFSYVKVWRSITSSFSNAAVIGTGVGNLYVDYVVIEGTTYYYWLQSISTADVAGAVISGGSATPTTDPTGQLDALAGFGVDGLPYYYVATETTINGITIPRGTYMWNAMIANASIGTAQIKDAAITSAKIDRLNADKIVFNSATGSTFAAVYIEGGTIKGTAITGNVISGGKISSDTSIEGATISGGVITGNAITGGSINGSVLNIPATNPLFTVDATGAVRVSSATSGTGLIISDGSIKVFDDAGIQRVKIGDLSRLGVRSFSPVNGGTSVAVGSNIVLIFDQAVTRGTGDITLRELSAAGTIIATYAPGSANVTISGAILTINPSADLMAGMVYYVVFPSGSITSGATTYTGTSAYSFTTGIGITTYSPANGATGVVVGSNIVLTFGQAVTRGIGNITLRSISASGAVIETYAAGSLNITISGSTLTINPTNDLVTNTVYYVVFSSGSVMSGPNSYIGTNSYSFTTA